MLDEKVDLGAELHKWGNSTERQMRGEIGAGSEQSSPDKTNIERRRAPRPTGAMLRRASTAISSNLQQVKLEAAYASADLTDIS